MIARPALPRRPLRRSPRRRSARRSLGFTLVELLVVIAIISMLLAMLLPAVQAAREAARRTACLNHLHEQILATHLFETRAGALPTGAMLTDGSREAGAGWMVLVLPQLEEAALYDSIGVKADGHMDARAFATPSVFVCPSAPRTNAEEGLANYAGVAGSGTADDGVWDLETLFSGDVYRDGVFFPDSRVEFAQITDGLSNTLAIGEREYMVLATLPRAWSTGATWNGKEANSTKPRKVDEVQMVAMKNARYPIGGPPVEFGYSRYDPLRPEDVPGTLLENDFYFSSLHPGGANFAMVDGSVHFFANETEVTLFRRLATRAGGELDVETP